MREGAWGWGTDDGEGIAEISGMSEDVEVGEGDGHFDWSGGGSECVQYVLGWRKCLRTAEQVQ